jgi:predicted nucleic acid-binding protein
MIVADTSVWVDYLNDRETPETETFDTLLGREAIIVGDLILAEVLQGFRSDKAFRQARRLLRKFPIVAMVGWVMAERSAAHYRELRKRGITIRKTIDVMIATYCIAEGLSLLYTDRDFDPMVRHLGLKAVSRS